MGYSPRFAKSRTRLSDFTSLTAKKTPKNITTYDPAIPFLSIYLKKMKILLEKIHAPTNVQRSIYDSQHMETS